MTREEKIKEIIESMVDHAPEHLRNEAHEQAEVFAEAYMIFLDRSQRHADTWKDSGWRGALFDIRKKIDRLWNEHIVSGDAPADNDSALDAINFLAFFIRAKNNHIEGVWRWK